MVAIPIVLTWLCFLLNTYLSDKTLVALKLQLDDIKDPLMIVNFRENFKNRELLELQEIIEKYGEEKRTRIKILRDKNIEQEILDVADGSVLNYYDNLIGAANIEMSHEGKILVKIFFSQNLIHSVAIMMNFVDNIMLKAKFSDHEIQITNSPLSRPDENLNYIQNLYTEFVPIGLMLYMILYLPFTFREKASGEKKFCKN